MAQQLLAALHALYHREDIQVKAEADKWLEQWQQSVEAWSVADAVLHDAASTMEAQYFCSQTLRTKVNLLCLMGGHARGPSAAIAESDAGVGWDARKSQIQQIRALAAQLPDQWQSLWP